MKCKICFREAERSGYCHIHLRAYQNIKEKFYVWEKASHISWNEYLVQIQKNSLTGDWAKEVVKYLIAEE